MEAEERAEQEAATAPAETSELEAVLASEAAAATEVEPGDEPSLDEPQPVEPAEETEETA